MQPLLKNQITQQIRFIAQIGFVPIFNIPETTIYSGIKTSLLGIPSVIGLESTYLTKSSEK